MKCQAVLSGLSESNFRISGGKPQGRAEKLVGGK